MFSRRFKLERVDSGSRWDFLFFWQISATKIHTSCGSGSENLANTAVSSKEALLKTHTPDVAICPEIRVSLLNREEWKKAVVCDLVKKSIGRSWITAVLAKTFFMKEYPKLKPLSTKRAILIIEEDGLRELILSKGSIVEKNLETARVQVEDASPSGPHHVKVREGSSVYRVLIYLEITPDDMGNEGLEITAGANSIGEEEDDVERGGDRGLVSLVENQKEHGYCTGHMKDPERQLVMKTPKLHKGGTCRDSRSITHVSNSFDILSKGQPICDYLHGAKKPIIEIDLASCNSAPQKTQVNEPGASNLIGTSGLDRIAVDKLDIFLEFAQRGNLVSSVQKNRYVYQRRRRCERNRRKKPKIPIPKCTGTDGPGRSICWPSIQVHTPTQGLGDKCSDDESHRIGDPEESSHSLAKACRSTASIFSSPSPVLKLACSYMKVTPMISSGGIQTKTREKCMNDISHEEESGLAHSELLLGVVKAHLRGNIGEVGCYSCKGLIDPFWPVCMFELRGRCNDEECLLQHVKDYSGGNVNQHDYPERADREVALSSHVEKVSGACNLSRSHQQFIISAPPTYLVGLDLLKADLPTSGSVLAQSIGRCWQKGFSTSSAVPFTIQKTHFPSGASFCGSDDCLGSQGSRSRQSMYFQRQDDSLIGHGMDDPEQCLDMALVLFDGDLNKLEGMKKARTVLSRALESNPTYVALWIVYLHIHYRNEKTIGKDDMFSHAIHYNEGSYELWLMYINSRVQLDDRLVAYDTAISALCRHASSPDRDRVHASACILDLFVQLLDCLCMSEDIGRAIQRIYGLMPTATNVANNGSILLSDILACLTVSDRCIFWICCVYVVIYRKLPDAVVHQFESEKELRFVVEWPSVELTASEKHRALELMKMGVDSVGLNGGMCEREVHFLSASYVQCVAVLEGIECSKNLLEKYFKLYPTCLELILTSARLHRDYFGDSSFEVFEDALRNWPREIPGVQCIWNQYAQCALESGGFDIAKQLMVRWFESVCEVDCPQSGKLDVMEDDGLYHSPESLSPRPDVCFTFSNPKDELFGLLNLSLHRLLQSDHVKARFAIDRALKVVGPDDFEHCVREHAVFVSSDILGPMEGAPCSGIMSLLNIYLKDIRVLPGSEPLSRMFCRDIRKPRIRQLINKILCPVPCNYSLVNSILDSCYGPTLLPENYGDVKDLVDLIETLMELYPANYPLALAVCKLITRKFTSSGIASSSILFWACSVLVNSIYQAFPVAPELKWVEVSGILSNLVEAQGISERFHQHALSIYPCSVELWKSYYKFSKQKGNESLVVQTARERGIKLE